MSRFAITDLSFFEINLAEGSLVNGGAIVPRISTAVATAVDTRTTTSLKISGTLASGFKINSFARGSAASAEASAVSLGGKATAIVVVDAG